MSMFPVFIVILVCVLVGFLVALSFAKAAQAGQEDDEE